MFRCGACFCVHIYLYCCGCCCLFSDEFEGEHSSAFWRDASSVIENLRSNLFPKRSVPILKLTAPQQEEMTCISSATSPIVISAAGAQAKPIGRPSEAEDEKVPVNWRICLCSNSVDLLLDTSP